MQAFVPQDIRWKAVAMTVMLFLIGLIGIAYTYGFSWLFLLIVFLLFAVMPLYGQWQTAKALGIEGWKGIIPYYNWLAFQNACDPAKRNLGLACALVSLLEALTTSTDANGNTTGSFFGLAALVLQILVLRNLCDHFGKSHWYVLGILLVPCIFWWKLSADSYIEA